MGALQLIPFKMCEIKVDPSVSSFATANLKKFPPAKKCSIVCPHLLHLPTKLSDQKKNSIYYLLEHEDTQRG